ncbi:MAG TPA: ABC transporter permease [Candidatus Aminicenantes bacterium]|nr:ABC transporter permease [Candidatus Aminicenantes bacterium]HRY64506.1 ABC transporter permease [Candidatus Aminicenantes bacterium]HRZ71419.1 ABC transporter permease [Candidatus Aminicenantes bacterium]
MIEKLKFFLGVTRNNLWQFRTRNLFSVTIICLSFLTVGIFLSLVNNLRATARGLAANMSIVFYLDRDLAPEAVEAIRQEISRPAFVEQVGLVSPEQALERFRTNFPDLADVVAGLKGNPFPPSLELRVNARASASQEVAAFVEGLKKRPGVTDVLFNRDWVEKMQGFSRLAGAVGAFLGGILILTSFFIISNVVKLNVFARKNEIEILRMVGGTNLFIRIPFWLEGITLGLLGSLLSLALLFVVIRLFPVYLGASLGALQELLRFRYPDPGQVLALLGGGAATGFIGSATSVSKFLKV